MRSQRCLGHKVCRHRENRTSGPLIVKLLSTYMIQFQRNTKLKTMGEKGSVPCFIIFCRLDTIRELVKGHVSGHVSATIGHVVYSYRGRKCCIRKSML